MIVGLAMRLDGFLAVCLQRTKPRNFIFSCLQLVLDFLQLDLERVLRGVGAARIFGMHHVLDIFQVILQLCDGIHHGI